MIERIKALILGANTPSARKSSQDALRIAVTALLVEASTMDGHFDEIERQTIRNLLKDRFDLSFDEIDTLLADAQGALEKSGGLYVFTHTIKETFDHTDRVRMIEMLWEVVYADGVLDDFESNLVRRIAGLLYVPDRESGEARKRVLEKMGNTASKP
ncbi:tellurite resistance TerB family protein [Varunaivibrio sulfuroxidans]|uniref:Putative tellurite resistance protein B-like protein n=1 Tax=Varunaivibrio sulfuroxidans TaxID=1773489 RepID=A0A4R3JD00_9PROT|nr:TerB family tellurite resistance protein [Varunaivibrio sulfuroxidans]TCS63662.1 putative tellurite resistance protein B-like protein [Varunaivibrio sulfuroxidans]WES30200.1 TerB family tellurite resistance protein [Varunaivibrio sulfuroxidans]